MVLGSSRNNLNISYQSLIYSLGFAVLHILREGSILYLDSKVCCLSIEEYVIICLNALIEEYETKKDKKLIERSSLNFEEITSDLCSIKQRIYLICVIFHVLVRINY